MKNIKKYFFISILFFSLTIPAFSQSLKGFGFKAGFSFASLKIESTDNNTDVQTSSLPGIKAGIFLDIYSKEEFTLFSELAYDQSVNDIKIYSKDFSGNEFLLSSVDYKVDYLNYDLNIKYAYGKGSFTPYAYAGPRLCFYLSDGSPSNANLIPGGLKISIHDNLKKFVFSAVIGIGFEIKISGKTSILAESSFSPGLFKSYDDDVTSAKINTLGFMAGLRLLY